MTKDGETMNITGARVIAGLIGTIIFAALYGVVGLFAGLLLCILGAILMLRPQASSTSEAAPVDTYSARQSIEAAERRTAWDEINRKQSLQPWQRGDVNR